MEEEQEIQRRILANKIAREQMQAALDFTDPTTRRASAGLNCCHDWASGVDDEPLLLLLRPQ